MWTEKEPIKNQGLDVKPVLAVSNSSSPKLVVETFNHDRPKNLKPLLKRPASNSVMVKTSSGPFIAEPIKERDHRRPRLTFLDSVS